jgi:hypothetical protein
VNQADQCSFNPIAAGNGGVKSENKSNCGLTKRRLGHERQRFAAAARPDCKVRMQSHHAPQFIAHLASVGRHALTCWLALAENWARVTLVAQKAAWTNRRSTEYSPDA